MDFLSICLLLAFWFVRPQDIIPSLAGVSLVRYVMLVGLAAMLNRKGGWSFKEVFRTPMDWMMYAYFGWIIWQSENRFGTAKEVFNLAAFYTCTALALTTKERFRTYLNVWLACITVVALLALCSEFGFEIVQGSSDLTASSNDRLSLNTWIFNNPNSLGHGAVATIPLAYQWLWWRRSSSSKLMALLCWMVAGYCVFRTGSKGAYLTGAAATMICILFGKSLKTQLLIIAVVLTAGVSALKMLPRMDTLDKHEEGIAARLIFWQQAWVKMKETGTGAGWKVFRAKLKDPTLGIIERPTHGSYVNVGADLGYPGLYLYVGVLFCGFRCLWQARCGSDIEWDRIQRTLLAIAACYATSAWVLDRAYHTDFFLMAGAIAAFHRIALKDRRSEVVEGTREYLTVRRPVLIPATAGVSYPMGELLPWMQSRMNALSEPGAGAGSEANEGTAITPPVILRWQRLGWADLVMVFGLFQVVLYLWDYLSTDFISL